MKGKNEGLLKDTFIMFAATSGVNLLNFVFHMYVSRKLGPEEYGVLVPLLGLVILFSMPAMALQMTIVKKTSVCMARENYGGIEHLFGKTTRWFLALGAFYFAAFIAAAPFIRSFFKIEDTALIIILALIAVISLVMPVVRGILQGMQ
ncbi:MAG TPA: oligosaccharide flippase family protein, partial [Candidatus Goldiibacteriota bacterium]|nr:oligosaccharide flippase family protein [Candidatus Goldiibacteriota bacterium]